MIASSAPTAARSRIALERVSRKSGRALGPTAAQMGDQGLLGGLVQPLLHHVDDQDGRAFGFQSGEQGDQRLRHRGAVLDEPGQRLIDPRLERRVGVQPRPSRRAAVRQPVQAQEGGVRQGLGQALGQPRLAAAQRADDVVQRPDVAQLEPLAAPGPGKVEGDAELGGRSQQARQFSGGRRLAPGEVGPQAADLLDGVGELADPAFERCLVRGQGRLQALRRRLPAPAPPGRG